METFLTRLIPPVRLPPGTAETLREFSAHGRLVYVIQVRDALERSLCLRSLAAHGLPAPAAVIAADRPSPHQPFIFHLAENPPGLPPDLAPGRRIITGLLNAQEKAARPTLVAPLLCVFGRHVQRTRRTWRAWLNGKGNWMTRLHRLLVLYGHPGEVFIDLGRPLDLSTDLAPPQPSGGAEQRAAMIADLLWARLEQQRHVSLGPAMAPGRELKAEVLGTPDIQEGIHAREIPDLRRKAGEYYDEIAADYSSACIRWVDLGLHWLLKKMFRSIDLVPQDLARVRQYAQDGPLVYVPCHKSHMDYMVLNFVLYQWHLHPPRIAAGQNLAFWPVGQLFRKCGVFFVRRTFTGARLYTRVFARYIRALLLAGHPLEVFIEGGRSRSGMTLSPKTGFLSLLLQAYLDGCCRDLVFVPVALVYDRVAETASYIAELAGQPKRQETFGRVLEARKLLKHDFGRVMLCFGRPLSLRTELAPDKDLGSGAAQRAIGARLIEAVNHAIPVTPMGLVTLALLNYASQPLRRDQVVRDVVVLLQVVEIQGLTRTIGPFTAAAQVREALRFLSEWNVIEDLAGAGGGESRFILRPAKRAEITYAKNCILHHFRTAAFAALALQEAWQTPGEPGTAADTYRLLKHLFWEEFPGEERSDPNAEFEAALTLLAGMGLIDRQPGANIAPTAGGGQALALYAASLRPLLESYAIVLTSAMRRAGTLPRKTRVFEAMRALGTHWEQRGIVTCREALSQAAFDNALRFLHREIRGIPRTERDPAQLRRKLAYLNRRVFRLARLALPPPA